MLQLKQVLETNEEKGHALLEMPTGTGKTVCIFSLYLALKYIRPDLGKLIYCTRTIAELEQCIEELKRVEFTRRKVLRDRYKPVLGICLSSRRNLCINSKINCADPSCRVDDECAERCRQTDKRRQQNVDIEDLGCSFYEKYISYTDRITVPPRIYSLADFRSNKVMCPYFMARSLLDDADVVVFNYQYVLDPSISPIILPHINNQNNILLFDEGHNIESVVCDNNSLTIPLSHLKESYSFLTELSKEFQKRSQEISMVSTRMAGSMPAFGNSQASPFITADQTTEIEAFIPLLKLVTMAMQNWISSTSANSATVKGLKLVTMGNQSRVISPTTKGLTMNEMRLVIYQDCYIDHNELRTFSSRLQQLLLIFDRVGFVLRPEKVAKLKEIVRYFTLVGEYDHGFFTLIEPPFLSSNQANSSFVSSQSVLKLVCCDAGYVMKPLFQNFKHIIITSGTLSLELYPKLLQFKPIVAESIFIDPNSHLCPVVVSRGNDQVIL